MELCIVCTLYVDASSIREQKPRFCILAERYPVYQANPFGEAEIDIPSDTT